MSLLTAWQFMIELGHNEPNPLQPNMHESVPLEGKTVLVNGAAGGLQESAGVASETGGRHRTTCRIVRVVALTKPCARYAASPYSEQLGVEPDGLDRSSSHGRILVGHPAKGPPGHGTRSWRSRVLRPFAIAPPPGRLESSEITHPAVARPEEVSS